MGDPSDDDVPTMTSSADLRRDDEGSGADADDRTIQKPPDTVAAIPETVERDRERTLMARAPKPPASTPSPVSSAAPFAVPRPAAGLGAVAADKLPPPPSHPLRPRLPTAPVATVPGPVTPAMRPRAPSSPGALGSAARPIATPQPMMAKAEAAKMEVARPEPAKKDPAKKSDSKSDVRTVQTARDVVDDALDDTDDVEGPPTLESEPPPSEPATSPKSPAIAASRPSPHTPKMVTAPLTAKVPSAPPTPKSPGVPPPPPKSVPSEPRLPSRPDEVPTIDGEPPDDGVTETAPRVPAPIIPLSAPKSVEIRTLDDLDDAGDPTEVKTLAGDVSEIVRNARSQSKAAATEASEADAADDSVTAQAPVHPAPPAPAPVIRIGAKSLMPQSAGVPATHRDGAYNPDEEDSVTARSLSVDADYRDDSVTTRSPSARSGAQLPAPIDGETEGTTKRVHKKPAPGDPNASEADERDDSVTAAAPGHLTNMLRVIASPSQTESGADDDAIQAHTQVMVNAPVKPPPGSESGLRVAPNDAQAAAGLGGDRASLGALGVAQPDRLHLGPARAPLGSDPAAMGPSPSDRISRVPYPPMPMPDADRKPPYALLVAVVAAISIAIPVILYVVLSSNGPDAPPRVISQPSPDPVGVSGARPKAGKPGPSATTPAPRSNNAPNGNNGRPSPFRR